MSKHPDILMQVIADNPHLTCNQRDAIHAAADALETLERENRKLRKAMREFKHGYHLCGLRAASVASDVLAALSRRRSGAGKRGNG